MESYTIIDNDIWKDNNIKGYEKLVLIYLVRNFNVNYGYSFPTREQIQEATGIGNNALNRALNSLEEKGYNISEFELEFEFEVDGKLLVHTVGSYIGE